MMDSTRSLRHGIVRELDSPAEDGWMTSVGMMAWYCFLALCVGIPCLYLLLYNLYQVYQRWTIMSVEAQQQQEATAAKGQARQLSRMEANVKVFSELENRRRGQSLRKYTRKNIHLLTKEDLLNQRNQFTPSSSSETTSTGIFTSALHLALQSSDGACSICMEAWSIGDSVMHSVDIKGCRHLYHERCILNWLVAQSATVCPCCRREFAGVATPATSIDTQEQFREILGGTVDVDEEHGTRGG